MGRILIKRLRFGVLEIKDENILLIPEGIIRLSSMQKRYVLLEDTEQAPFQWLQSSGQHRFGVLLWSIQ